MFLFTIVGMFCFSFVVNSAEKSFSGMDDTMLMFVGEDLEVLTIASRREEKAWGAPAVATVITKKQINENGFLTASEALATIPGFYMAHKEWGAQPYLRGISDSILFLYDTVPVHSDVSKILHQIDNELSLAPIKRLEIIRGPGSVLWGADAFAGIVNFVPLSGKDINGIETGIRYGIKDNTSTFYVNSGVHSDVWDFMLSVSGREGQEDDNRANIVRFWKDDTPPVLPGERYGNEIPEEARYLEVTSSAVLNDTIRVSCRISDYFKPFVISENDTGLSWIETRDIYSGYLKIETQKLAWRKTGIRFNSFITWLKPENHVVDSHLKQNEKTFFSELVFDHPFFSGTGLLNSGISFRMKQIDNAPIWEIYLPDYLSPENDNLLPIIQKEDYSTHLWSLFAQYNQEINNIDIFAGVRNDYHDAYKNHTSFNSGVVWAPEDKWMFKLIYGTAFRTPFNLHILEQTGFFYGSLDKEEKKHDLERINNMSFQVAYKAFSGMKFSVCGFNSRIENHVVVDKYAGLSVPGNQDIHGLEFEFFLYPFDFLDISSNLTLLRNKGPDQLFKYNDYFIIRLDGTIEKHYIDLGHPYNSGPDCISNFSLTYRLNDNVNFLARMKYFSSMQVGNIKREDAEKVPETLLFDMNVLIKNIFLGADLDIILQNMTFNNYKTPGTYNPVVGESLTCELLIRKKW